jgi:hypothetical protein
MDWQILVFYPEPEARDKIYYKAKEGRHVRISNNLHYVTLINPVLSSMSYVTLFHCSLGRSRKTGLSVLVLILQTGIIKQPI